MKYLKALFLLVVAAAALMAFAGTASATFTFPTGVAFTGTVKATSTNTHTTGTVKVACKHSALEFPITNGATSAAVSSWTFIECNPDTVTVLKRGTLTFSSTGTIVSSGLEVTKQLHKTILGFPITTHCIYVTNNTDIGILTDSHQTGGNAIIHLNGEKPRVETDSSCGTDPGIMTGTYTITSASPLYLD